MGVCMTIVSADELYRNKPPGKSAIIGPQLLTEHGSLLFIGETESGKSVLAFDVAFCIALGRPLFSAFRKKHDGTQGKPHFPVHRSARVLYIDTELGPEGCYERVQQFYPRYCAGLELGDSLKFVTGEEQPLLLHNIHGEAIRPYNNLDALLSAQKP